MLWAQQIGGNRDEGNFFTDAFKVDAQNKVYIARTFASPSLTLGNTQLINQVAPAVGNTIPDIFIAKIDSNG